MDSLCSVPLTSTGSCRSPFRGPGTQLISRSGACATPRTTSLVELAQFPSISFRDITVGGSLWAFAKASSTSPQVRTSSSLTVVPGRSSVSGLSAQVTSGVLSVYHCRNPCRSSLTTRSCSPPWSLRCGLLALTVLTSSSSTSSETVPAPGDCSRVQPSGPGIALGACSCCSFLACSSSTSPPFASSTRFGSISAASSLLSARPLPTASSSVSLICTRGSSPLTPLTST